MLEDNSRRYMTFTAPTIISCKYYYICFCDGALLKSLYKIAASLKGKRISITTPPYQVPSVDITPDPPIFSLVTTFNCNYLWLGFSRGFVCKSYHESFASPAFLIIT
jgi:hypothetical protein